MEEKINLLLELLEQPKHTTDERLAQLLEDDALRELAEELATAKRAFVKHEPEGDAGLVDEAWERFVREQHLEPGEAPSKSEGGGRPLLVRMPRRVPKWQKRVAAMLAGIALLGGVAWAVVGYRLKSSPMDESQSASVTTPLPTREGQGGGSSVQFSNVRLDSILSVVAGHYGKVVQFRNDKAREMRLIMTWNPADSLADFVSRLNRFEGLTLTLHEDTLVVESNNGEGE